MDFGRILRSLEEFLYELMTWIVFYPRTMLRIVARPVAVSRYAQLQLSQEPQLQYTEMMTPVLMLIASVIIPFGISFVINASPVKDMPHWMRLLEAEPERRLIFSSIVYSLYALAGAMLILSRRRTRIDREVLRGPFHVYAYLTSPLALAFGIAGIFLSVAPDIDAMTHIAIGIYASGALWYIWAQTRVLADQLEIGAVRACVYALSVFVGTTICLLTLLILAVLPEVMRQSD